MLYCKQFENYEDFKSRFGYKENINGEKLCNKSGAFQRKHNIVYQYWKENVKYLHDLKHYSLSNSFELGIRLCTNDEVFINMLYTLGIRFSTLTCSEIFKSFEDIKFDSLTCYASDNPYLITLQINGKSCAIKIGKYINKLITYYSEDNKACFWKDNQTLRTFFIEQLAELWKSEVLRNQSLDVVVNKDFEYIYSSKYRRENESYFNSCMDDREQYYFYQNHDDVFSAVSLQDSEGNVYARCILVRCFEDNNTRHILLDRIYYNKKMYRDLLFTKAKNAGIFDIYKDLEATCHESDRILDISGERLNKRLNIYLNLENEENLSYQDTFKFYDPENGIACNISSKYNGYINLDTTNAYVDLSEYIEEDEEDEEF